MKNKKVIDEEFVKYLNDSLYKLEMSEKALADGTGVAQKSINRYRNRETSPSEEVKQKIRCYLAYVLENKVEKGKKYISEEEKEFKEMLESLNDGEESIEYISERLKFYTPIAQRYIVRFLPVYLYVDKEERDFIEKLRKLNPIHRKRVVAILEKQPMSIEYLEAFEFSEMNNDPESPTSKMRGYLDIISAKVELSGKIHNKYDKDTKDTGAVAINECKNSFDEMTREYYYVTGKYISKDIFERIEEYLMEYKHSEWYILYLYNRLKVVDVCDKHSKKTFSKSTYELTGERINMLYNYIEYICKENEWPI